MQINGARSKPSGKVGVLSSVRNVSGGTVQMGTLDDVPGVSPMELILVGLAGCTGVDIVDILAKKREPLQAIKVKVRGKKKLKISLKSTRRSKSPI